MRGRVFSLLGNAIEVRAPEGVYRCSIRGKARRDKTGAMKLCTVGDEVEFTDAEQGEGIIEKVLPRKSRLSRHDPASPEKELVIVANVDAIVVVNAARSPDLDLLTIDKCLVLGAGADLPCILVVNKMDLATEGTAERVALYRSVGIPVFLTCAIKGDGVAALRAALKGKSVALVGPSGVGKSSLVNALLPGRTERTGAVKEKGGRGRHTTTWATMFDSGEGFVVDTPGLEYFTAWGATPENLKEHFPEFAAAAAGCKFRDCSHTTEPKCAVRDAAAAGPSRYGNYLAIRQLLASRADYFKA